MRIFCRPPDPGSFSPILPDAVQCPGLTGSGPQVSRIAGDLAKRQAVFSYKLRTPLVWVSFVGGTGTGKSTLFNAFCGHNLAQAGVERPKTRGPIAYAHRDCPVEKHFPLPGVCVARRVAQGASWEPIRGSANCLVVLDHPDERWKHLVAVDTPDLDSLEPENRQMAEDCVLLSDVVVFVASEEKYADAVPAEVLAQILEAKKPCYYLVNKVQERLATQDVLDLLHAGGLPVEPAGVWSIRYAPEKTRESIAEDPGFLAFRRRFLQQVSVDDLGCFLNARHRERAEETGVLLDRLLDLLAEEKSAAGQWLRRLEVLFAQASQDFSREQTSRSEAETRQYMQRKIRELFAKYDLLARPRRYVRQLLRLPLELLGLVGKGPARRSAHTPLAAWSQTALGPVLTSLETFNRRVLEDLSPSDAEAPLFGTLRAPGVALDEQSVRQRMVKEQEALGQWLNATFEQLAQRLPRGKKWGIYSTTVVWGILIVCFEVVVGGGFTVLDAALDAALSPFVTKGAVELFALGEVRKTTRALAARYQEALLSVLREQKDRYVQCLQSLLASPETVESLKDLRAAFADWKP